MFEKHEIWERSEDYIILYVVFRDLDTGLHHVQQANFVSRGGSAKEIDETLASQSFYLFDVFDTQLPSDIAPGFATIKEAVEAHRREFADMAPLATQ